MAEGAPLLRVYGGNSIEGSNPSLSATIKKAPLVGAFLMVGEVEALMRTLGSTTERSVVAATGGSSSRELNI